MNVEGLAEVKSWVLSFGSLAKVLSPDEFREGVAVELRKAREKYI